MTNRTLAAPHLERLNSFVGVWDTDGEVLSGAGGAAPKFRAKDIYEWLPGGFFLLHRFDADMPDGRTQGIEAIGYSVESKSYFMHSFDSAGNATLMHARFADDTWTFVAESARFTGAFSEDGNVFAGLWERRADDGADWQPWMKVRLTKLG